MTHQAQLNEAFLILLVEDDPHTLLNLAMLLRGDVPHAKVLRAACLGEAGSLIEDTIARGGRLDLAVLDCLLPSTPGAQPAFDTRLCGRLRALAVPIIHYSGEPSDQKIRQHMDEVHADEELASSPVRLIEKTVTPDWANTIVKLASDYCKHVISGAVRQKYESVHGPVGPDSPVRGARCRPRQRPLSDRCGTHAKIALERDLRRFWDVLEPDIREAVEETYAVHDVVGAKLVRLSLFPVEDNDGA